MNEIDSLIPKLENAQGIICDLRRYPNNNDDFIKTNFSQWIVYLCGFYLEMKRRYDKVYVVGLSMGGPVAARYANKYPDQVAGVILISPEVTQSTNRDIFPMNIPGVGEYLMSAVMEPYILPKLQAGDFTNPDNFPEWESKYREQMQFQGTGRALLPTIRELGKLNPEVEYQALQRTELPVMLIWGDADQTIGPDQIEVLQQILPELAIRIVEDGGHLVHYESSDKVNSELIDFLDQISN